MLAFSLFLIVLALAITQPKGEYMKIEITVTLPVLLAALLGAV